MMMISQVNDVPRTTDVDCSQPLCPYPYVTLPYLYLTIRSDVLPPSVEASNGPNAHPRINRKVTKSPSAVLTWSIPTTGTIPLLREGLLT